MARFLRDALHFAAPIAAFVIVMWFGEHASSRVADKYDALCGACGDSISGDLLVLGFLYFFAAFAAGALVFWYLQIIRKRQ